ncbi:MAG: DUF5522 domain-containing protein [Ginsengibacter sp.]
MNNDLVEGVDFYYDGSGLMVFKKKYHLERGYCCGNGCRHCPYHFENVTDEKRRKQLIQNENKQVNGQ